MPIRVAFIDHTAQLSGGEIALLNLVTNLDVEHVTPIVILFADGPLADRLRSAAIETHILAASSDVLDARKDALGAGSLLKLRAASAALAHAWRLRRLLRELNVDIVHTNSLKSDLIGGLAGRLARKPVIWHVRDRIDADYLPRSVVRVFRRLARWLPRVVIANSESTRTTLKLPSRNCSVVIHDGTLLVPASTLSPLPTTSPPIVGLIGRITRWKGQAVLIRAAALLRDRGIVARYRLIGAPMFGEEDYQRELVALVNELNVADRIDFAGFQSDIGAELANLSVVVHTSITPEPFGQVVIEAMAANRPVIAAAAGGVVEIIENGISGLLVPPNDPPALADAIAKLLGDPALAAELVTAGRKRVEARFTIERVARDIQWLYETMDTGA